MHKRLILGVLAASLLVQTGCASGSGDASQSITMNRELPVIIEHPSIGEVRNSVDVISEVTYSKAKKVHFALDNKDTNLYVFEGSNVRLHQELFPLSMVVNNDPNDKVVRDIQSKSLAYDKALREYQQVKEEHEENKLKELTNQLSAAKLSEERAKAEYQIGQSSFDKGQISKYTLADLKAKYDDALVNVERANKAITNYPRVKNEQLTNARLNLDKAKANLEEAKESGGKTDAIYGSNTSPIDGMVAKVVINDKDGYVEIADANHLSVTFQVVGSLKRAIYEYGVVYIGERRIETMNLLGDRIELALDSNDQYSIGDAITVSVPVALKEDALTVPRDAVLKTATKNYVFTVEGNIAKKTYVTVGLETDDFVEVTSGLNKNDQVVVAGQTTLVDGSAIAVEEKMK